MSTNDKRRPLPPGWCWARLGEVCEVVTGTTPPRSATEFYGGDIPWAKPDDLDRDMHVETTAEFLTAQGASRARILPAGSVLVSCIGNLGKVGIGARPMATNQQINALVPSSTVDSEYIYFYCKTLRSQLESLAGQTTITIVNKSTFASLHVPVPSLDEQRRIAARLSQQMALVGKMRQAACARLEAAEALPAVFLRQVFESEEARRWPNKKLGGVCSLTDSGTWGLDPRGDVPTWPILRSNNIQDGEIVLNDVARRVVPAHVAAQKVLAPGDILVTKSSGSAALIGKCALVHTLPDEPHLFSNFTLRLRLNPKEAHPEYVLSYLHSPPARAVIAEIQNTTTGLRNLDLDRYLGQLLPLAPLGEQRRIAAELKAKLDIAETMRRSAQSQLEAVNALPAALLEGVFGGFEPPS